MHVQEASQQKHRACELRAPEVVLEPGLAHDTFVWRQTPISKP